MASWLCILDRMNFSTIERENIWGVAQRFKKTLEKTNPGDLCAFYLIAEGAGDHKKNSSIGAIFEIISTPYEDEADIFPSKRDKYPCRVRLKPIKIFNPELQFKPLIPIMDFIINKENYRGYLMGKAMIKITDADMNRIMGYDE
jgi:predicted RNA-binding protein